MKRREFLRGLALVPAVAVLPFDVKAIPAAEPEGYKIYTGARNGGKSLWPAQWNKKFLQDYQSRQASNHLANIRYKVTDS